MHADREALRAEARADLEMFQNRIPGLTEQQGILDARLDNMPSNQQSPAR